METEYLFSQHISRSCCCFWSQEHTLRTLLPDLREFTALTGRSHSRPQRQACMDGATQVGGNMDWELESAHLQQDQSQPWPLQPWQQWQQQSGLPLRTPLGKPCTCVNLLTFGAHCHFTSKEGKAPGFTLTCPFELGTKLGPLSLSCAEGGNGSLEPRHGQRD